MAAPNWPLWSGLGRLLKPLLGRTLALDAPAMPSGPPMPGTPTFMPTSGPGAHARAGERSQSPAGDGDVVVAGTFDPFWAGEVCDASGGRSSGQFKRQAAGESLRGSIDRAERGPMANGATKRATLRASPLGAGLGAGCRNSLELGDGDLDVDRSGPAEGDAAHIVERLYGQPAASTAGHLRVQLWSSRSHQHGALGSAVELSPGGLNAALRRHSSSSGGYGDGAGSPRSPTWGDAVALMTHRRSSSAEAGGPTATTRCSSSSNSGSSLCGGAANGSSCMHVDPHLQPIIINASSGGSGRDERAPASGRAPAYERALASERAPASGAAAGSVLCRICELMVPAASLAEHSSRCAAGADAAATGTVAGVCGGATGGAGPHADACSPGAARAHQVCLEDFEVVKPISRGAHGRVFLVRKRATGDLLALKVLSKRALVRKNLVSHVLFERDIMSLSNNPFVVRLLYSFTTARHVCLAMEYLNGGDLFSLLKCVGRLAEPDARAYVAELVCALEHVHKLGIIHRDLKPDNLLIGADGHLKLADFGVSASAFERRPWSGNEGDDGACDGAGDGAIEPTSSSPLSAMAAGKPSERAGACGRDDGIGWAAEAKPTLEDLVDAGALDAKFGEGLARSSADVARILRVLSRRRSVELPGGRSLGTNESILSGIGESDRVIGTPDYISPESLEGRALDTAVDWWSVGCILYEFLVGVPPFAGGSVDEVFANIRARRLAWPAGAGEGEEADGDYEPLSAEAKDLVERLLTVDPARRLGARGAAEVRAHPFFAGVNWAALACGGCGSADARTAGSEDAGAGAALAPAFVPSPAHEADTSYFIARRPASARPSGAVRLPLRPPRESVEDRATAEQQAAAQQQSAEQHLLAEQGLRAEAAEAASGDAFEGSPRGSRRLSAPDTAAGASESGASEAGGSGRGISDAGSSGAGWYSMLASDAGMPGVPSAVGPADSGASAGLAGNEGDHLAPGGLLANTPSDSMTGRRRLGRSASALFMASAFAPGLVSSATYDDDEDGDGSSRRPSISVDHEFAFSELAGFRSILQLNLRNQDVHKRMSMDVTVGGLGSAAAAGRAAALGSRTPPRQSLQLDCLPYRGSKAT